MIDYKEKIRKLLALSKSENVNEAMAALLKAKELMAEHKLSEADIEGISEVKDILLPVQFGEKFDPWANLLAGYIADNYCCKSYGRWVDERTKQIGFVGLPDDVDICAVVFTYAHDCVKAAQSRIRKKFQRKCTAEAMTKRCDSFGYGFAVGLRDAYIEQRKANPEWALIPSCPKETEEYLRNKLQCQDGKPVTQGVDNLSADMVEKGYREGRKFSPMRITSQ